MAKKETAGIITEYNPFHAGHKWMVQQLKNSGVQTVVCVMSSQYVQRAEPALFPVDVRVKAAIASGADLILRLPVPWAIQSAEGFGLAGAGMLAALGCVDLLAFGAETPEIEKLQSVADFLGTPAFETEIKQQLATGESFAAARQNFERNYFKSQYNSCDGNISEISRRTGVDRKQLYKKLYEFAILQKLD